MTIWSWKCAKQKLQILKPSSNSVERSLPQPGARASLKSSLILKKPVAIVMTILLGMRKSNVDSIPGWGQAPMSASSAAMLVLFSFYRQGGNWHVNIMAITNTKQQQNPWTRVAARCSFLLQIPLAISQEHNNPESLSAASWRNQVLISWFNSGPGHGGTEAPMRKAGIQYNPYIAMVCFYFWIVMPSFPCFKRSLRTIVDESRCMQIGEMEPTRTSLNTKESRHRTLKTIETSMSSIEKHRLKVSN